MATAAEVQRLTGGASDRGIGNAVWTAGVCAVLVLQATLILRHEYFVDEWQALQIAVQSPDLPSLLANLRYEGHPPLWYLLLRGLSVLVGPHRALPAASLSLGLATQCLVLFKAPFPRWLRLAIALGEPILFEYGTVSRSYALGVALTFWALAAWNTRRAVWIPLVLLPGVEAFFGVFSLALLLHRFAERKVWWPGIASWAAVSLAAAWSVMPAPDFVAIYPPAKAPLANAALLLKQFSIVMVPFQWGGGGPRWNSIADSGLFLALWVPFALLCFDQTRKRPLDRIAVVGLLVFFLLIYVFSNTLANRHLMLMGVLLIALQWRQSLHGGEVRPFFRAWLGIGALCGLATASVALATPFDTAPRVAKAIERLQLRDEHWVSAPAQHAQGVSAISGVLFEGIGTGCMADFVRWNAANYRSNHLDIGEWVRREATNGRFYLVSQLPLPPASRAVEIARVPAGYDGKAYYLYRVGSVRDRPRNTPGRCVPGTIPLPPRDE